MHVVLEKGLETNKGKTEVIRKWHTPITVTEVHSFLGFTNYYRRFIENYAQVSKPLYGVILGQNASRKNKCNTWTLECKVAFNKLKELCRSTPVLAYATFTKQITHKYMWTSAWYNFVQKAR